MTSSVFKQERSIQCLCLVITVVAFHVAQNKTTRWSAVVIVLTGGHREIANLISSVIGCLVKDKVYDTT